MKTIAELNDLSTIDLRDYLGDLEQGIWEDSFFEDQARPSPEFQQLLDHRNEVLDLYLPREAP